MNENDRKWPKMTENDRKWTKMNENERKWMNLNEYEYSKVFIKKILKKLYSWIFIISMNIQIYSFYDVVNGGRSNSFC